MLHLLYPYACADSVFAIDYEKLYLMGYRGILFDIDNTLVHHGDDSNEEVDALFRCLHRIGMKTFLLSNNSEERVLRFIRNIDTQYLCLADKPKPDGYRKAVEQMGIPLEQAICIGDQIFTDILGANRSGMASILVRFIRLDHETRLGKRRQLERLILACYRRSQKYCGRLSEIERKEHRNAMVQRERKLFCEMNPLFFAISTRKEIVRRKLQDARSHEAFTSHRQEERLPHVIAEQHSGLIKRAKGIDPRLQENKAVNIGLACRAIHGTILQPGETFSFWKTVGDTTRRKGYRDGRVLRHGKLQAGLGGGLCNLANTIHRLILHSPLEVTEFHSHSDALAPDPGGVRVPFSAGTSVCYNYIDYRFRNNTSQRIQLLVWCENETLYGELRSEEPFPYIYDIVEKDHHFQKEGEKYYRVSQIYKRATDRSTGETVQMQLVLDNHSEVMFDEQLIPRELIR